MSNFYLDRLYTFDEVNYKSMKSSRVKYKCFHFDMHKETIEREVVEVTCGNVWLWNVCSDNIYDSLNLLHVKNGLRTDNYKSEFKKSNKTFFKLVKVFPA